MAGPVTSQHASSEAPDTHGQDQGTKLMSTPAAIVAAMPRTPARSHVATYTSPLRHVTWSVKVDAPPDMLPELALQLPSLVRGAVAQAAAAAAIDIPHSPPLPGGPLTKPSRAPLLALHCVTFPGCVHLVMVGEGTVQVAPVEVARILEPLLPRGAQLLSLNTLDGGLATLEAAVGLSLNPVAVGKAARGTPEDQSLQFDLVIPSALTRQLELEGRSLRVVVSDGRASGALLKDVRVRPKEAGWPTTGSFALDVCAPDSNCRLVLVTVLRGPRQALVRMGLTDATAHGVDEVLSVLPLLVMAPAVCMELRSLWGQMESERGAAHGGMFAEAFDDFARHFAPLAIDLDVAMSALCGELPQPVDPQLIVGLRDFFTLHGMAACLELLDSSEQQGGDVAALSTPSCESPGRWSVSGRMLALWLQLGVRVIDLAADWRP